MGQVQHIAETKATSRLDPRSVRRYEPDCRRGWLKKRISAAIKEFLVLEAQACTNWNKPTFDQRRH